MTSEKISTPAPAVPKKDKERFITISVTFDDEKAPKRTTDDEDSGNGHSSRTTFNDATFEPYGDWASKITEFGKTRNRITLIPNTKIKMVTFMQRVEKNEESNFKPKEKKKNYWRKGYEAYMSGDSYSDTAPEDWKDGYKAAYHDFLESGREYVAMEGEEYETD